jgi:DNA-binding response OmpR family regulator
MIVEDQALIAMSIEAYLEQLGFEVAGPFPTGAKALKWLESDPPELAILDIMLRDGPCVRLARELKQRCIPFVIYSGLRACSDCPPELRGVPWLEKPASRESLAQLLDEIGSPN